MPIPANTGKFAKFISKSNKFMDIGSYALIGINGTIDSYNAVASISAYASIDEQYEKSEALLKAIIDHSEISEMRDAAKNLKKTVEGDRSKYAEIISPVISSLAEGTKTFLITAIVEGGSKFAPWVWAVDTGLAVGDLLWNISDIDEASLAAIALGDAATCLSKEIRSGLAYCNNVDYCIMDKNDIAMINNLAQLRICSEDMFMEVMDNYPAIFNLVHRVLAGDWLTEATAEACEANKNLIIMIMDRSEFLFATKEYKE